MTISPKRDDDIDRQSIVTNLVHFIYLHPIQMIRSLHVDSMHQNEVQENYFI